MVINSLSFCLFEEVFFSPSFLKGSFAGYSILGWQFLSYSTLNVSSHTLLACNVSVEKLADNLTGLPYM